ncbi:hypothetical protein FJZ36_04260 [Candidatus Poribacteria bacterium]|nr:hypothetical protein [Candidatus Poribacteria bacterium]
MNTLKTVVHATIRRDADGNYVGTCDEIAVDARGARLEDVVAQLRDEVVGHLRDERVAEFTLSAKPKLQVTIDLDVDPASQSRSKAR